ncbi:bifunctional folylpolyglutamate synthase/dihydrofolate synthase [Pontimicrobium aquaticum]|uniref:Dihydrofolate synthase/folylpolyglutamate synthase n=1 Tax=Pontimicrobium aquaticum TaxID=2565367 RepID=A0A4U0EX64_9FLAO|nr:folylpolyglutamate synthase/dihydrofolate synthase family protein [Pontimicrobium aquaticum]TJY36533.1 bifunctional folylpolyglutamate synthase/dihydrofolate synthase [Pontimicrobium aquaticum]
MNYTDTVNWMFCQLPMYQNKGKVAFKKDLTNTLSLAKHLDHLEKQFKSIHVAGTNGKGSTSHMLASVLQEAGFKVGLYTSPHLKDFRERIKVNGKVVSKQFVIQFIKRNKAFLERHQLSFFEMTVGMAFDYFAKQKVDIAVIEVGLGGRLDSTNIIMPEVSVITNIGLDHTQFLGDTLEQVACEKAGIIKQHIPVVIGETQKETEPIFRKIAKEHKAPIYFADQIVKKIYESDLKGSYQTHNIKTVAQALTVLQPLGFNTSEKQIIKGLKNVVKNTGLLGRWQILQYGPKIICDTAHNKEGLTYVMQQLSEQTFNKLHMVIGMVNDKNIDGILDLFPKHATYYFCKPNIPRGLDATILKEYFNKKGYIGEAYQSVNEALEYAKKQSQNDDLIYVGGSTFVVAEII